MSSRKSKKHREPTPEEEGAQVLEAAAKAGARSSRASVHRHMTIRFWPCTYPRSRIAASQARRCASRSLPGGAGPFAVGVLHAR